MAYTGTQREKGLVAHRMVRRSFVPALVVGPALAISLCNPLVAFAADAEGAEGAANAQAQVVYTSDAFSSNADYAQSASASASDSNYQTSFDQTFGEGSYASEYGVSDSSEIYNSSSEIAYNDSNTSTQNSGNYGQQNINDQTASQNLGNGTAETSDSAQESVVVANNSSSSINSGDFAQSMASQAQSGGIVFYDSHEANITFSAGDGGSVAPGSANQEQKTSSDGEIIVVEYFADSLEGESGGAVAVADDGYHFVKWVDETSGNTLSTSVNFAPARPEDGWPYEWFIKAVFAPDVYQVRLDVNGGKASGGGGSGGFVSLDVVPGSNFQLPANGTEFTFAKVGSAFSGWNTVPDPGKAGATTALAIEDGAVIDADLETQLRRLGVLSLDWSNGSTPVVTLYAQWVAGQSTITYKASEGGSVSANASSASSVDGVATETINAINGEHLADTSIYGPQGAKATASSYHHFVNWGVSGSAQSLQESEAGNSALSAATATRLSHYAEYDGLPEEYHAVTFTASFAPNTYVFRYGSNGGSGSVRATALSYGSSFSAATAGFTRDGYELAGWNTAADGSGSSIGLGAQVTSSTIDSLIQASQLADSNNAETTLYAMWNYVGTKDDDPVDPDPKPNPDPDPDPDPEPTPDPTPDPDPAPDPEPTPDPTPTPVVTPTTPSKPAATTQPAAEQAKPAPAPSEPAGEELISDNFISSLPLYALTLASNVAEAASDNAADTKDATQKTQGTDKKKGKEESGLLASKTSSDDRDALVAYDSASGTPGSGGGDGDGGLLDQMMTPEGMQQAGTAVGAVVAVGALMGLVGLGVSVAGAAVVSAAAIGTAGAVGLSSAADLAADLAAASAAAGAAGAARKRREDEDDVDEP